MEKIAQVIITKTQNGMWKITRMSLNQVESCNTYLTPQTALIKIGLFMHHEEWEQLSLDV